MTTGRSTTVRRVAWERVAYAIDADVRDRDDAAAVCAAIFDLVRPDLRSMGIDVCSDYRDDEMPEPVLAAQARLNALARRRHTKRSDPGISLSLTPDDAEWADAELFAPWSIYVSGHVTPHPSSKSIVDLHDCAMSIVVELTDDAAAVLREQVAHIAPLVLLADIHRRRREARERAREARRAERRAKLRRALRIR